MRVVRIVVISNTGNEVIGDSKDEVECMEEAVRWLSFEINSRKHAKLVSVGCKAKAKEVIKNGN